MWRPERAPQRRDGVSLMAGLLLVLLAMVFLVDDLTGLDVLISNGERDPMIPRAMTLELERQLTERGARVTDLAHPGGHQLDRRVLAQAAEALAGF